MRLILQFIVVMVFAGAVSAKTDAAFPPIEPNPDYPSPMSFIVPRSLIEWFPTQNVIDLSCTSLINRGAKEARSVRLDFTYVDPDGVVVYVDTQTFGGHFPPGVRVWYTGNDPRAWGYICSRVPNASTVPTTSVNFLPAPKAAGIPVAAVLVSAREVDYIDGTIFRAMRVPKRGDVASVPPVRIRPVALQSGLPIYSAISTQIGPVEVSDVYALAWPQHVCVSFINRGTLRSHRVRIDLELVDRSGQVFDTWPLYAKGKFSPGVTINWNEGLCAWIRGSTDGDTFTYETRIRTYKGIGRIIAVPVSEDFDDGTSWKVTPPRAGIAAAL